MNRTGIINRFAIIGLKIRENIVFERLEVDYLFGSPEKSLRWIGESMEMSFGQPDVITCLLFILQ